MHPPPPPFHSEGRYEGILHPLTHNNAKTSDLLVPHVEAAPPAGRCECCRAVEATLWQLCELHLMVEGTRIALSSPILHPEHCEDGKRMFLEICILH